MAQHTLTLSTDAESGLALILAAENKRLTNAGQPTITKDQLLTNTLEGIGLQRLATAQQAAAIKAKIAAGTDLTMQEWNALRPKLTNVNQ